MHDINDQMTWEWSENAAVVILNYMIDPDGYGMPWARFEPNIAEWIAAMNVCDEPVDLLGGGTAARYRLAGTFDLTSRPRDVTALMQSACDARIWQRRDGTIGINVGKFSPPPVAIESRDILGYRMERGQDQLTSVAGLRAEYMSPDHDYREHEAEPWPNGSAVVLLDEDRADALDLSWVPSRSQARRLMKREYLRRTAGWRGTLSTNLAGLRAMDERFITIRIDELAIDESFEVNRFTLDPSSLRCQMDVISVGAEIDEWDPTEEGSVESGAAFAYSGSFAKTGTAVDPIVEAGGAIGQTAVVFCTVGDGAAISATPAGWEEIQRAGPTSSLSVAAFMKVLDGSEVSTTFLAASGAILVAIMAGAPSPSVSDINIQITTGEPTLTDKEAIAAPYAVFAFGACNANQATADWLFLMEGYVSTDPKTIVDDSEESLLHSTGSNLSGLLNLVVFQSEETPAQMSIAQTDEGTNGLLSFIMKPGS